MNVIAFQGAPGAFSHQAAIKLGEGMNEPYELLSQDSFEKVFKLVAGGGHLGAVPLENSSVGSIVANYDSLWNEPVFMIAETYIPIHHQLIVIEGTDINEITEVYSHPVALDQCRKLFREFPNMKPRVHWDTSGSALYVRDEGKRSNAAIASEMAAREAGLSIIRTNVEDHSSNTTRFGLITANKKLRMHDGPHKLSCAFELEHTSGSLAQLLTRIAAVGANLSKIESRPIPQTPWHYRFFLDVEVADGKQEDAVIDALQGAAKAKVLGCYVKALEVSGVSA